VEKLTNEQLSFAVGVPLIFNAALTVALWLNLKSNINTRFDSVNQLFDDMRDLWRAELRRVEEVLDARLKHMEGRA
jgi:hypothetical protein